MENQDYIFLGQTFWLIRRNMTHEVNRNDNEIEFLTQRLRYIPDPNHPEKTKTASKSYKVAEVRTLNEVDPEHTTTRIDEEI